MRISDWSSDVCSSDLIADAIDDERLDRGGIGARLLEPETDQQIARQPHAFPAEEHLDDVVRGHAHQNREGENREIDEEARLIRILLHIAPAIEVDESRYGRDDATHNRRPRIDPQLTCALISSLISPTE